MKIICIGRNYIDHAKELKNPLPTEPLFFLKPETCQLAKRMPFFIPDFTNDVHHEIELVIKIDKVGKHIAKQFAHKYYSEITVGIDFTARDIQQKCKDQGLPWEKAKSFDGAAPVGEFIPKQDINLQNLSFSLKKNNTEVQAGNSKNMIFTIDDIISYVSSFITLKKGDLIFTGTPAGVSAVNKGDELLGFIERKQLLRVLVR